jgi:hypothetical protein
MANRGFAFRTTRPAFVAALAGAPGGAEAVRLVGGASGLSDRFDLGGAEGI